MTGIGGIMVTLGAWITVVGGAIAVFGAIYAGIESFVR